MSQLTPNIILDADSYKPSHFDMYPSGTTAQYAYGEARKRGETIVPFGFQMSIKKHLLTPVTMENIDEADEILSAHGEPFNRAGWERILNVHGGLLPITIKCVLEGTPTPSLTPIYTIESNDPMLYWIPSYIESMWQRSVWYPTTIASNDLRNYRILKQEYDDTSDKSFNLHYALHDFGARGVSSQETSEIGGLAHLLYFRGTDNLVALRAARAYYNEPMAGHSIRATEHSIQCAYGKHNQLDYIGNVLNSCKHEEVISIVLDGYDIYRDTEALCIHFKNLILEKNLHVVIRPDSGDAYDIIPKLIHVMDYHFGHTENSKGYKVLNNVSLIQGDGIDTDTILGLCKMIALLGYAAETLVYGSGGGLLQKVNRDTYSFAQKTSAMKINGEWVDTVKDPVTDSGKKSKGGRFDDLALVTYYENGKLLIDDSLEVIRQRALG
jgi:nicotinamide phosphoribosyltransferase